MEQFKRSLEKFKGAVDNILKNNIDLSKEIDANKSIYDFKDRKLDYYVKLYHGAFKDLKAKSFSLSKLGEENQGEVAKINVLLKELEEKYNSEKLEGMGEVLEKISGLSSSFKIVESGEKFKLEGVVPDEVRDEINADLAELGRCFNSECYRSCAILCGRLLEVGLHRKYFDVTGHDILEKSPGIGLGKVVAKLSEKEVKLDPGLTQQIHLINNVRIFSVHKKQEAFYPTKQQTQAMVLYTLDILEKIFQNDSGANK
ncbi:MAG: hypothetical protein QF824_00360 [Candidatus Woesearchaeota archaeon]|jgi:hypothetical protein|nr:hypothetical protein [Candidatus Woesearchaeota archaeon]